MKNACYFLGALGLVFLLALLFGRSDPKPKRPNQSAPNASIVYTPRTAQYWLQDSQGKQGPFKPVVLRGSKASTDSPAAVGPESYLQED